jgi:enterochelin esterase-like enzyme
VKPAAALLGRRELLLSATAFTACSRGACEGTRAEASGEAGIAPRASVAALPPPDASADARDPLGDGARRVEWRDGGVTPNVHVEEWTIEGSSGVRERAVLLIPSWASKARRLPLVVALHGRGEALKGPLEGPWGWARDYALVRACDRVSQPPLTSRDFEGFVSTRDLAEKNRSLAERPYGGVVVACPWVPDLDMEALGEAEAYGRWLVQSFLPLVRGEAPVVDTPEATGVDGISLGGFVALVTGLRNPASFGAASGLQPALHHARAQEWVDLARVARTKNPRLALRLLTSDGDVFRAPTTAISEAWRAAAVPHDFSVVVGPHDYPFNRGPGSIELLTWHDRILRRA